MTDYRVKLDIYSGPLDLLLYLIRRDEIDIYDIPIASITEQFLQYVELIQKLNLEHAGDFLVMAATLMEVKSALLLPREELTGDEEEDLADPRLELVRQLLESVRPGQVYVAGDLSDPHGTHRVCAQVVFRAIAEIEQQTGRRPEVMLYRGAWQEWAPHVIDVAVPLSPRDLRMKKEAIFRHESQKDTALFPGPDDPREFWQRAEDRNRHTADLYNRIGLPEYYAMEAFVRWNGQPL